MNTDEAGATDVLTPEQRRLNMSRIRGKNTRPELTLRRVLHSAGLRYRLHVRTLPGRPDLVLPKYRAVIFVHGCFWHRHECPLFRWPRSREAFWREKLERNVERDAANKASLLEAGWRVLTIWECAVKSRARLSEEQLVSRVRMWLIDGEITGTIEGWTTQLSGEVGSAPAASSSASSGSG